MSSARYMTHELAAVIYRAARLTSLIAAGGVTGISGRAGTYILTHPLTNILSMSLPSPVEAQ